MVAPPRRRRTAWSASFALVSALVLASAPASAQSFQELSPQVRAFTASDATHFILRDVTLIDGTGAPARTGMSVVVRDGVIEAVGPADQVGEPEGAEVVEGAGHTLIPGLVMLHEHLFYPSGRDWRGARYNTHELSFPPLYLAGGVTTMRTGGSVDPYTDLGVRDDVAAGRIPGPRIDVTGPYLEGPGGFIRAFPELTTPQEARDHVDFWMDRGVTSFKAYNLITREVLGAAIDAAHARGAEVTGHLCSITYAEAAELGIDNLEHGFFAATDWSPGKEPDQCVGTPTSVFLELELDGRPFLDVVDALVEHEVALTSTLNVVERSVPGRPLPPDGAQAAIEPALRADVMASVAAGAAGQRRPAAWLEKIMAMEKAFYDRGGLLVAGIDPTGAGDVVPGYGNQRTIQLLLEMGLSVEEAVRVVTLNGATYLERADEVGTVEVGKRADLVLMSGDLRSDPETVRRMRLVFKDGVAYDSPALFESVRGTVGIR
mgnify:CR=1 FL=1